MRRFTRLGHPGKQMKVHAYRVRRHQNSAPLEQLLRQIEVTPLVRRDRRLGHVEVRCEAVRRRRNGTWFMDFVRLRFDHGPGRVHRSRPIRGFNLRQHEGFGEETAALYDPVSHYMLIQYNHHGVRAGKIQEYICEFVHDPPYAFELIPKYDEETERRLQRKTIFRRLDFKIATRGMNAGDRRAGIALTDAIEMGNRFGAEDITISLSAGRGRPRGLIVQSVTEALNWLRRSHGLDPDSVSRIVVTGRDAIDSETEILDLLAQRLITEFQDLPVGRDLRYPRNARWSALERARIGWGRILRA